MSGYEQAAPHGTAGCGCSWWLCQRARAGLDVYGRPYPIEDDRSADKEARGKNDAPPMISS